MYGFPFVLAFTNAHCTAHRFARPVSRMLMHTRQCVEDTAFSNVRVSRKSDQADVWRDLTVLGKFRRGDPGG